MTVSALIFDFDGLLLDTESPLYQSWRETYEEHGVCLSVEEWSAVIGTAETADPLDELERRSGRCLDRAALHEARRARRDDLLAGVPACEGVIEVLEESASLGLALAVASSSPALWVDTHLRRLGLREHFGPLSCFDGSGSPKPAPDLYLGALEALGVGPDRCIAFEDSSHGLVAAKAAGLRCVVVPNPMTGHMDFGSADMVLTRLGRPPLARIIEALDGGGR